MSNITDIVKNAAISGFLFGLFMGGYSYLTGMGPSSLTQGAISGVLFALLIGGFQLYQYRKFSADPPLFYKEVILHQGPANRFLNGESVGGWLWLTHQRLYFRSHKVNFQNHEGSIFLGDISSVDSRRTFGIVPNGMHITTNDGGVEKFVVSGRARWKAAVDDAISKLNS